MDNCNLNSLVIDTSSRDPKIALVRSTKPLSVRRENILDALIKSDKSGKSDEIDVIKRAITDLIGGSFKCRTQSVSDSEHKSTLPATSSRTLIPQIGELLAENQLQPEQVDLVVIAMGPGSFTGLRIGVVAAKTLAYANQCSVVGINLMEAAAFQAGCSGIINQDGHEMQHRTIGVAMNAGRGDVLAASFGGVDDGLGMVVSSEIRKPNEWAESLPIGTLVTGNGNSSVDADVVNARSLEILSEKSRIPCLEMIGLLGLIRMQESGGDDYWKLQPIYSRPSAAEEALGTTG